MTDYNQTEALERPILTYDLISSRTATLTDPDQPCLMATKEFLKLCERLYRFKISRRNLQLYSSPGYRFIPLPVHKGGYTSYYLNPEHTVRLAVAMHLQKKHYFPTKAIQKVMKEMPEDQYRFILQNNLTGEEILESAALVKEGYGIKDILYRKVCRVLEAIDEPYWKAINKFGKGADEEHEKFVDQALVKESKDLADWIKSGRRQRIEMAEVGQTDKEQEEIISWLHAIQDKGREKSER